MSGRQILHVARREYLARVRSKSFIISTLLVPVLLGVTVLLMSLMGRADVDELRVAVVDAGTGLGTGLAARLEAVEQPRFLVEEVLGPSGLDEEATRRDLSDRVRRRQLDGYLVLRPDPDILARLQYVARETSNIRVLEILEGAHELAVLERWLAGSGVDPEQIRALDAAGVSALNVSERGEEAGGFGLAYLSSLILGMVIYMTVLMHGQQMAMAIVEEKSSRLIELVIAAVTAVEFMAGKVLGVLATGVTQLAIWAVLGLLVFFYALPAVAAAAAASGVSLGELFDPVALGYFVIFFLLGYVLYATLMAAIGATCTSTEELGNAMAPATLPMVFAFFFMFYAVTNPNSWLSRAASFFPPFTPLVMFARVNVARPPWWEVWLGIAVLAAGAAAAVWAAAKIFRVAILLTGKRPNVRELYSLLRAA